MKRQLRDIQPGIAMLEEVLKTIENKRKAFMHINDVRFWLLVSCVHAHLGVDYMHVRPCDLCVCDTTLTLTLNLSSS